MGGQTKLPAPLTDSGYWRRLLATVHPDRTGADHELFLFLTAIREHVESCAHLGASSPGPSRPSSADRRPEPERIPFDPALGFADEHVTLTMRALSIAEREPEPYRAVLRLLLDCPSVEHGRRAERQCKGATYKQLALIGHRASMSKEQRVRWYAVARTVPLSEAHAAHVIDRLATEAA